MADGDTVELEPAARVVYHVDRNEAEHHRGAYSLSGPVHALSFELVTTSRSRTRCSAPRSSCHPTDETLIRCDRVDFPPGGVAYLHTHQGPGIRVLLHGSIRIDTAGQSHSYGPLEAWFEPGPEPVFAAASETEPTAFVRCMVLPGRLRGQSSIRYVRDAGRRQAQAPEIHDVRRRAARAPVNGPRTGGKLLADQLVLHGCELAFCVPGESYLPLLDGLFDHRARLRVVTCRHESAAANAAEAAGKLTGRPGVCMVTRGPGATHAAVGVHTARQDSTPLILLVGQVARGHRGREAFQELDVPAVFGPMAKAALEIDDPDRIPELVAGAFTLATSGRQGPVVISLPEDVLAQPSDAPDADPYRPREPAADPRDIAELRACSRRPSARSCSSAGALGRGGLRSARGLGGRLRSSGGRIVSPPGRGRQRAELLRRRRRPGRQPAPREADRGGRSGDRRGAAPDRDRDPGLHPAAAARRRPRRSSTSIPIRPSSGGSISRDWACSPACGRSPPPPTWALVWTGPAGLRGRREARADYEAWSAPPRPS